jgi:hypothetical protein
MVLAIFVGASLLVGAMAKGGLMLALKADPKNQSYWLNALKLWSYTYRADPIQAAAPVLPWKDYRAVGERIMQVQPLPPSAALENVSKVLAESPVVEQTWPGKAVTAAAHEKANKAVDPLVKFEGDFYEPYPIYSRITIGKKEPEKPVPVPMGFDGHNPITADNLKNYAACVFHRDRQVSSFDWEILVTAFRDECKRLGKPLDMCGVQAIVQAQLNAAQKLEQARVDHARRYAGLVPVVMNKPVHSRFTMMATCIEASRREGVAEGDEAGLNLADVMYAASFFHYRMNGNYHAALSACEGWIGSRAMLIAVVKSSTILAFDAERAYVGNDPNQKHWSAAQLVTDCVERYQRTLLHYAKELQ